MLTLSQPWTRVDEDSLLHVSSLAPGGATLGGIQLFHFDPAFRLIDMTEAQEAHYADHLDVTPRVSAPLHRDGSVTLMEFDRKPIQLAMIPSDFSSGLAGDSEMMTFQDIRESRGRLYQNGSPARLLTDYYGRIAFPLVTIIMAVPASGFSLRRSGSARWQHGDRDRTRSPNHHHRHSSLPLHSGKLARLRPLIATTNVLFTSYGLYLMLKLKY